MEAIRPMVEMAEHHDDGGKADERADGFGVHSWLEYISASRFAASHFRKHLAFPHADCPKRAELEVRLVLD